MLKGILKREISKQFLRFGLVGLEGAILTYLIYLILFNFFNLPYTSSYIFGFIAGTLFGFYFNKYFSFESKEEIIRSLFIYLIVYSFSLLFGSFFIKVLVNNFGMNPIFAIIPISVFTTLINFFGIKIFAFKNKKW
jgi:putative flippase GtrA